MMNMATKRTTEMNETEKILCSPTFVQNAKTRPNTERMFARTHTFFSLL